MAEANRSERFCCSIVRVVPDPIKDEAVNIGIVVTRAEGAGGVLRAKTRRGVRTKLRAMQPDFDFDALDQWLDDAALGIDEQLAFGEIGAHPASAALLEAVQQRLSNQLQLTPPQRYVATSADEAADRLFARNVSPRRAWLREGERLTHAQLRERIWRVVRAWEGPNVKVAQGGFLQGQRASHAADIVISNGHSRAALYALPVHYDQTLTFLYRDSLPTIAADMGSEFQLFAVLPSLWTTVSEAEQRVAAGTRRCWARASGCRRWSWTT